MTNRGPLPTPDSVTGVFFKEDLNVGSTLTRGVQSQYLDRATRRFEAKNVPATIDALDESIKEVIAQQTLFHPTVTDLPLAEVTAVKWGAKAWVDMKYRRVYQRWAFEPPRQDPWDVARFRGGYYNVRVYGKPENEEGLRVFLDGYPAGSLLDEEHRHTRDTKPGSYNYTVPLVEIYVSNIYTYNPYTVVGDLQGSLNDGPITIGQYVFQARTLRFDTVDVDWFEAWDGQGGAGQAMFATDYKFTASVSNGPRFATQDVRWNEQENEWQLYTFTPYRIADWGAFDPL